MKKLSDQLDQDKATTDRLATSIGDVDDQVKGLARAIGVVEHQLTSVSDFFGTQKLTKLPSSGSIKEDLSTLAKSPSYSSLAKSQSSSSVGKSPSSTHLSALTAADGTALTEHDEPAGAKGIY